MVVDKPSLPSLTDKYFIHPKSQVLPEPVIPALHMGCFTCFFSRGSVLLFRNDSLVGLPKIALAVTCTTCCWNGLPQATTCLLTSISHCRSHQLFVYCGTALSRSTPGSSVSSQKTIAHPISGRLHTHRLPQALSPFRSSWQLCGFFDPRDHGIT